MKKIIYSIILITAISSCEDSNDNDALSINTSFNVELSRESTIIYSFTGDSPSYRGKFRSPLSGIDKYVFEIPTEENTNGKIVINFYAEEGTPFFEESAEYPLAYVDNITLNEISRFGPVSEIYFNGTEGFSNGPGPTSVAYSGLLEVKIDEGSAKFIIEIDGQMDDKTPLDHNMKGSVIFLENPGI